jgi:hypothetical protein
MGQVLEGVGSGWVSPYIDSSYSGPTRAGLTSTFRLAAAPARSYRSPEVPVALLLVSLVLYLYRGDWKSRCPLDT